jgi:NAD(P)H-hydrate epimerase
MKVLTAAEMQACDRVTTERFGVPSQALMRKAAEAVANFAREQFPQARKVTVLCGRGNNGGDGLMTARMLATAGLKVTTILLGAPNELKGDAAAAWRELTGTAQGMVYVVRAAEELAQHNSALQTDLIIDAVVGTGFTPPLRGLALAALAWMKASATPVLAPILAIDLPSGWPADATEAAFAGPVFPADAVITFTSPKPAHVFGQLTRRWDQPVVVSAIGSPDAAIVSEQKLTWAGASHALVETPRAVDSNKGKFGHVLVVGGAFGTAGGKAGAPAMTSMAALRAGAGLVTAAVPAPALAPVAHFAAELMTRPLPATAAGEIAARGLTAEFFEELTKGMTVLAIGPGMGQGAGALKFLTGLLDANNLPAVLDADALNLIAATPALLKKLSRMGAAGRTLVMTPHPGEMARLADMTTKDVQARRLDVARGFAEKHHVTLVLKGARTLIAHPDGSVAVNTSGNPAMAKGGSGDMLTGWVAGLLAQYAGEPARAVEAAVYLHGLAADFAVREADEHTLLATDTLRAFSQAFRFRPRGASGYVLLQGHCVQALHAAAPGEV